jgi:hypothetical protein
MAQNNLYGEGGGGILGIVDGVEYSYTLNLRDTEAVTMQTNRNRTTLIMPSTVTVQGNTFNVIGITDNAFSNLVNLTTVTLPISNYFTTIGINAFKGCISLTSINIPSTVVVIGLDAFSYTSKLTEISVDSNNFHFSSLNGVLFNKNKTTLIKYPTWNSRTSYTVPSTVTSISTRAFAVLTLSDNKLTSIILNNGLVTIGDYAFRFCAFTSIIIPSTVTTIASNAFSECLSLVGVTFMGNIPTIGTANFDKNTNDTAYYYPSTYNTSSLAASRLGPIFTNVRVITEAQPAPVITSVTPSFSSATINFTQGTTAGLNPLQLYQYSIDGGSTWESAGLVKTSPITVTGLTNGTSYDFALRNYNGLTSSFSNIVPILLPDVLPGTPTIDSVTVSNGQAIIAFTGTNNGSAITGYQYSINNGSNWVFLGTGASTSITVTGLTNETTYDFKLRAVNALGAGPASNTVNSIVKTTVLTTFVGTGELTAATVTSGIRSATEVSIIGYTSIGASAFQNYTNLTSITIPNSVLTIHWDAFNNTSKLTEISVDSNNFHFSSLNGVLFNKNKTTLIKYPTWNSRTSYTVPSTVTSISTLAFAVSNYSDNKLTSITLNTGLVTIYEFAFRFCAFTSIIIPSSVTTISHSAFYCESGSVLVGVTFMGNLPTIGLYNFQTNNDTAYYYPSSYNTSQVVDSRIKPIFTNLRTITAAQPAPVITSVTPFFSSATINFTQGTTAGLNPVQLYQYSIDGGLNWVPAGTTNTIPITVTGLTSGTSYNFTLRNFNGSYSGVSNTVGPILLRDVVPSAPTITNVTVSSGQAVIAFTGTNNGSAITGYQYSIDNGSNWVSVGTSSPITVTGLTNETTYDFRLRAVNSVGPSPYASRGSTLVTDIAYTVSGSNATITGTRAGAANTTTITIPITITYLGTTYNVTSIGGNAFQNYTNLTSITIPNSVLTIGLDAFNNTSKLTEISVDSNNNYFSSLNGVLFDKNKTTLIKYPTWNSRTSYTVPSTVTSISTRAFAVSNPSDNKLTYVTLNNGLVTIGDYAFRVCTFISSIIIPSSVTTIANNAFRDCSSLVDVTFMGNLPTIGSANFDTNTSDTAYYYPSSYNTTQVVDSRIKPIFTNLRTITAAQPAPVITSFIGSNQTATINFTQSTTAGLNPIKLYQYSIDSGSTWESAGTTSPITVTGLTGGTSYNFILRNFNGSNSTISNNVSVLVISIPSAPTITSITVSSGQAVINFTAAANNGSAITGNQYSIDNGSTWVSVETSSPVTITGLTNGTSYDFRLRAVNDVGYGPTSNIVNSIVKTTILTTFVGTGELTAAIVTSDIRSATEVSIIGYTSIGASAFSFYTNLTSITISASVTSIYTEFQGCSSLTSIVVDPANTAYSSLNNVLFNKAQTILILYAIGLSSTSYTIPSTVTSISERAFQYGSNLTSVTIPNGVLTIGGSTFYGCSLTSIFIPASVTSIGDIYNYTFFGCPLTSILVDSGNTSYSSLNNVLFNKAQTTLIQYPIRLSSNTYTVPNTVTTISPIAFSNCINLASVTFMGDIPTIASYNFTENTNDTAYYYTGAQNISRLSPTPAIFTNVRALTLAQPTPVITSVTPSNKSVTISFTQGTTADLNPVQFYQYSLDGGLNWVSAGTKITSPITVTGLTNGTSYDFALRNFNGLYSGVSNIVPAVPGVPSAPTITNITTSIGQAIINFTAGSNNGSAITGYQYSKDNGTNWVSVGTTTPITVTGLTNETTYDFQIRAVNAIGAGPYASRGSTLVTDITYTLSGSNATITGTRAGAVTTTTVTIPSTITYLGTTYNVTSIGNNAFQNYTKIVIITIPNNVITIGTSAFSGCSKLESITLQNNISFTTIGTSTFQNCSSLKSIYIPSCVTTIGTFAFSGCSSLVSVTLPNNVLFTTIGTSTFQSCSRLTNIIIPNSVTSIGSSVFNQCNNLTNIIIGSGVLAISNSAFQNCSKLATVTFTGNIPTIGTSNFTSNTSDTAYYTTGANNVVRLSPTPAIFANVRTITAAQPTPVITSITTSSQSATINFTQGTTAGLNPITRFEYSIDSGVNWVFATITTSPITVTGLTDGTSYNFALRNFNGSYSGVSNIVPAVPGLPSAPTITNITVSSGQAIIAFTAGANNGSAITGYQYSKDNGTNWTSVATTSSPITVTGLTNGTSYDFRLRAVNTFGGAGAYVRSGSTLVTYITYTLSGSTATVTGISVGAENTTRVNIPSTISYLGTTYNLTSIGYAAFAGRSNLTYVTIPNTVTSIGNYAFYQCSGLTFIDIPFGVTSIGDNAFEGCSGLSTVFISSENALGIPTQATNVSFFGATVTTLIPPSFTTLNEAQPAPVITSVTTSSETAVIKFSQSRINTTSTSFSNYEYSTNNGVTWVPYPQTNFQYSSDNGVTWVPYPQTLSPITITGLTNGTNYSFVLRNNNGMYSASSNTVVSTVNTSVLTTFIGTGELTQQIVNDSIGTATTVVISGYTSIGYAAFAGRSNLTYVTIPNTVTAIYHSAFDSCSGLTTLNIPNSVNYINNLIDANGNRLPFRNSGLSTVFISSENSLGIPTQATNVSFFGATVTTLIPPSFTTLNGAQPAPDITSVTTSSGTAVIKFSQRRINTISTSFSNYEYSIDNGVTWVTYPQTIFQYSSDNGVTWVPYPQTLSPITITGLTNGTNYSFVLRNNNGMYSASSNTVVSTVNTSVLTTFIGTGDLTPEIVNASIGTATRVVISGYTSIAPWTFNGRSNLTYVTIPNTVTFISNYAFEGCSGLTTLNIPNSVNSIGGGRAFNASGLTTLFISSENALGIPTQATNVYFYGATVTTLIQPTVITLNGAQPAPDITSVTLSSGTAVIKFSQSIINTTSTSFSNYEYSIDNGENWVTYPQTNFQYSSDNGVTFVASPQTLSPITITGLTNGTNYSFALRNNNGVYSASSNTFYTVPGLPSAPTITSITTSSGQAIINFTAGSNGGSAITGYQYSKDNGTNWVSVGISSPITVTGLTNETTYDFQIRAVNAIGAGPYASRGSTLVTDITYTLSGSNATITGTRAGAATTTTVTIPSTISYLGTTYNVTSIGNNAFQNYSNLTSISIPNSVLTIGLYVFYRCSSLTSITIPNTVQTIGHSAFFSCTKLESVILPINNSFNTIGINMFYECFKLESIFIPSSVTSIGGGTFVDCNSLESIVVDSANTAYSSLNNVLFNKAQTSLIRYPPNLSSTSYTIPDGVQIIDNNAFQGCSSLASIIIPSSVQSITAGGFYKCTSLTSIFISSSVTSIAFDAFFGCSSLASIVVDSANTAYSSLNNVLFNKAQTILNQYACGLSSSSYTIPDGVTSITLGAFGLSSNLASITIPNSVTNISDYVFIGCSSLASVTFQSTSKVTSIGYQTFYKCSSLQSITIPNSVTVINYEAFRECSSLFNVFIGSGVTNIHQNAFYICPSLASVTFMGDIPTIASGNFTANTSDTAYYYPNVQNISRLSPTPAIFANVVAFAAPPTITSITTSSGEAIIAFTAGEDGGSAISGYQLSKDNGLNWSEPADVTSITATGLTNGIEYTFLVRAINAKGTGAFVSTVSTLVAGVPDAPTINSVIVSSGEAIIAFTAGENNGSAISGYQLSKDNGLNWTEPADVTSITAAGLTNGTEYTFLVRAVNAKGTGAYASTVSTLVDVSPGAPTITGVTVSSGQAIIAFIPGENNGSQISGYQLSIDDGYNWFSLGTTTPIIVTGTSTSITAAGLTNGTEYSFLIKAVNAIGPGTYATTGSILVAGLPDAPTINSVNVSSGQAIIAFTAGENNGSAISDYQLSIDSGSNWFSVGTTSPIIVTGTSSSITATGLSNGAIYTFLVRAVNSVGAGASVSSVSTLVDVVPDAPTITGVTISSGQAIIDFTGTNNGSAISGYQYSTNNGTNWTPTISILSTSISNQVSTISNSIINMTSATSGSITVTNLTNGTTYVFRIIAVNTIGASIPSNSFSKLVDVLPGAPTINSVNVSSGQATVAFTAGTNIGSQISGYEYSIDSGSNWNSVGTLSPITVPNLTNGIEYTFLVRAVNTMGGGAYASSVSTLVDVLPDAPTITGVTVSSGQAIIDFTGTNNGSQISGYQYSTNNGSTWTPPILTISTSIITMTSATSGSITVTNLTNGTTYVFRIIAVNTMGASIPSNSFSKLVDVAPGAPTINSVNVSSGQATVAFTPGENNGSQISSYQYSKDNGSTWVSVGTSSPITVTTGLTNGIEYTFLVRAVNTMGAGAYATSVLTLVDVLPDAPTINSVNVSSGQATVAFTAGTNNGSQISGYQLSKDNGLNWTEPADVTSITVPNLTNGIEYTFLVRAVNTMGAGAYASSFSKLVDVAPGAPTINSVNVSSGRATIAFTAGTNNGSQISSYQYSKDNGSTWVSVGTSSPITVTTGLTNGTEYPFLVRAVNAIGAGQVSNLLNKKVRPTLLEAKAQNAVKADYITYGYQLQELVASDLHTLPELKQNGHTLNDLKAHFTTDDLITSWSFSGSELKQEGLIESGITFIYLVIVFNGVFSVNRTYGLNNINKEDTYYSVVFEGEYSQNKLTSIPI